MMANLREGIAVADPTGSRIRSKKSEKKPFTPKGYHKPGKHFRDKIRFYIPIGTPEQVIIRDEVAKKLSKEYTIVIGYMDTVRDVDGTPMIFPISKVEVFVEDITDEDLEFFKHLAGLIAAQVGDSVVIEVTRETSYTATARYNVES